MAFVNAEFFTILACGAPSVCTYNVGDYDCAHCGGPTFWI